MRLLQLNVENFRNIAFASVDLGAESTFLLGSNGQGKSNLLEAAGLITAVRSFRTTETRAMIRQGEAQGRLLYHVKHEQRGECEVELALASGSKTIMLDQETIGRLADFIGLFPAIPLSSEDIQLLRGSPSLRRRALDLMLAATDPEYFRTLSRYHQALKDRNKLLKDSAPAENRRPFERLLAAEAVKLNRARQIGIQQVSEALVECYQVLCGIDEQPALHYKMDSPAEDETAYLAMLVQNSPRDEAIGSTQRGPHRDDLVFRLKGKPAREYASDGQQRGLVVAFRLAQLRYFQSCTQIAPVVLADDVLGELDPKRRDGFWQAVGNDLQVIATGTEPPVGDARQWRIIKVESGTFEPLAR